MTTAHFEHIQDHIIQELKKAHKSIEIAVAWFTNQQFFDLLIRARQHGVMVSLLIQDDIINRGDRHGLDFQDLIEHGGNLYFYRESNVLMHNKYCIIDGRKLITGSYNWTYAAEYNNKENIIISDDTSLCEQFSFHFYQLIKNSDKIGWFRHIQYNATSFPTYSKLDELLEELSYMQSMNITTKDGEQADTLLNKIQSVREDFISHDNDNKYILTQDIGLLSKNATMLVFVEQGTQLPTTKTMTTVTMKDYQENGDVILFHGQNTDVRFNTKIGVIPMPNIPRRKAEEVRFKDTIFIDIDGHINYSFVCLNNGEKARGSFDCPEIVRKF